MSPSARVCVCECPFVDSILQLVGGLGMRWIVTAAAAAEATAAAVCMYWCVGLSALCLSRQKRDKNENCLVYFIKSISQSSSSSMFMRAYMTCTCTCVCACMRACVCADEDDEAAKKSVKAKSETGNEGPMFLSQSLSPSLLLLLAFCAAGAWAPQSALAFKGH